MKNYALVHTNTRQPETGREPNTCAYLWLPAVDHICLGLHVAMSVFNQDAISARSEPLMRESVSERDPDHGIWIHHRLRARERSSRRQAAS
ncbi:hypothetical protein C2845_PM02G28520 [Panicum miliaceum]|uniref:Uncharacterized protein n=1 Tax=Panicum miliaceum TaxID=4540 RepID=A0A3L6SBI3_PANMI|nr:hypothetical protein C2845_PM02G28520 [Panicum miliaceum]